MGLRSSTDIGLPLVCVIFDSAEGCDSLKASSPIALVAAEKGGGATVPVLSMMAHPPVILGSQHVVPVRLLRQEMVVLGKIPLGGQRVAYAPVGKMPVNVRMAMESLLSFI